MINLKISDVVIMFPFPNHALLHNACPLQVSSFSFHWILPCRLILMYQLQLDHFKDSFLSAAARGGRLDEVASLIDFASNENKSLDL